MTDMDDNQDKNTDLESGEVNADASDSVVLEGDPGGTAIPPAIVEKKGAGLGRRLAGLLAAALGLAGCVLSFALLATSVRVAFSASDEADTAAGPLSSAVARLETRIDQADDLIDSDGVSGTELSELRARVDGLADTAAAADQAFATVDNHVIYRWLPVDTDKLRTRLEQFSNGAAEVAGLIANGDEVSAADASAAAERLNSMQTAVSSVDEPIDSTVDSLIIWIRLTGLGGFLLSLWSLWAQTSLMKRGWRGLRGQPV
jgi:hypothetical protein